MKINGFNFNLSPYSIVEKTTLLDLGGLLCFRVKNELKEVIFINYIYAFDLSMDNTGLTIFDKQGISKLVISFKTNPKYSHGKRLKQISDQVSKLREIYPPDIIVMERGFSRFNTSTQVIYRVHGLVNYLFEDCEQIYYPPKKVKEAILKGDATKKQIQSMINEKYPDVEFKNEDESDSFAVGLTYFINNGIIEWDKSIKVNKKKKVKKGDDGNG